MNVRMIDIAREAGVTRQAVSAVLNHPDTCRISAPVQKKIVEIAAKLGYVPNITAKILKGGSSGSIGILSPPSRFGVTSSMVSELVNELQQHGLNPQVKASHRDPQIMKQLIRDLEMRGVDGIIFHIASDKSDVEFNSSIPHITIGGAILESANFATDTYQGGFMATEHLIKHGRKRIATLAVQQQFSENAVRFKGWHDALAQYGLPNGPELQLYGKKFDYDFDRLTEMLMKLKVDAVFCKNDYVGGKLISELLSRGVKVPDDIAVIGFDGMSFCDFCAVPLATVAQPVRLLAKNAVNTLLKMIKTKEIHCSGKKIAIPPLLMPNASCGCTPPPDSRFFHINTYQTLELDRLENFGENIFNS